ncbi:MAG: triple tyrosine motif-containing protein, partial [Blastocatellia bacterium]
MNQHSIGHDEFAPSGQGLRQAAKTRLLTLSQLVALLFCWAFASHAQQLAIHRVEFVGMQFTGEDGLNYQYRLEGPQGPQSPQGMDADWSAPGKTRAVNYAGLAPGDYRFLVRAINLDGAPSASPATFTFRILPPFYLRWWFLTLA